MEWKTLSGCSDCINSSVCDQLGNCVLLTVNKQWPEYNKKKRRVIARIRTYGNGNFEQLKAYEKVLEQPQQAPVNLTSLEKLFLKELHRKR